MTTPFWCLMIVVFMPIVLAWVGGYFRQQQFGSIDNKTPRVQAARLEGAGARATAAQANAWEALPMFTAAVIVAHLSGVSPEAAAPFAIGFVVSRILHAVFYLADLDKARSAAFLAGIGCLVMLFVKAA